MKHGDDEDFDLIEDGETVKVEVVEENGEKKVTVTTNGMVMKKSIHL